MDPINLDSFLKFGYFLKERGERLIHLPKIEKDKYRDITEDELVAAAAGKFRAAVDRCFDRGEMPVVPLSGGLDSRAILAALLEVTDATNIRTYTFGTPQTFDYEIGRLIAQKVGTRHTQYPLGAFKYSNEEVFDVARRIDCQTVLFHHPPVWAVDKEMQGGTVWSGFMGETVAGDHLPAAPSATLDDAKRHFIRANAFVTSLKLHRCRDDDFFGLLDVYDENRQELAYEEQLDIRHRQVKYIRPQILMKGYCYKTPFIDPGFMGLMLSAGGTYRYNSNLYRKVLLSAFPALFKMPTKTNSGLPLDASKAMIRVKTVQNRLRRFLHMRNCKSMNFIDFNNAIRTRSDFKDILHSNIMDLKKRRIMDWIDPERIWLQHCSGRVNSADALMVLASLEIHLKCGKEI